MVAIEKIPVWAEGVRLVDRVAPAKARKSCKVPIGGYPFGARLYSECREISIWNQISTGVHCLAETDEYFPVARPWGYWHTIGAIPNLRYKVKSDLQRSRPMEDTWMRRNSEEAGQYKVRHTMGCVAVNDTCKPFSITLMVSGVGPMGVNKDVNVDENQGWTP